MLMQVLFDIIDQYIMFMCIWFNFVVLFKEGINLEMFVLELEGKIIIIVDDVVNIGCIIFYVMQLFMSVFFKKVEVVVLIDWMYKMFLIRVDYVGFFLVIMFMEDIDV